MTRLEKLQKKFRELVARSKELRAIDPATMTDEESTELRTAITSMETLKEDIAAEERAVALELENTEPETEERSTAYTSQEDQPVYRGSFPLGQQMRDIIRCTNPATAGSRIGNESRSRLDQAANRAASQVHANDPESRAAGTGQIEAVGSEGGFLLATESSVNLITRGFNNSEILNRCARRTLTTANSLEIVGIDETSRANGSRHGGIRVYTNAELDQMTSSHTKFKKIKLEPKKLTGLWYASDEILDDAGFLEQEMSDLFAREFAFKTQDLVINGTGAGEPLGILNAGCLVSQDKETGQAAASIVYENALKMYSRITYDSTPIWLINRDCLPQLSTMNLAVGTGGVPVWMPANGAAERPFTTLFGHPVIPIEQCQTVGTKGDIYLADFSQYIVTDKGGIQGATSIHLKFDYNQTAFRFTYRFDGQPRWSSALTPYKGTSTTSPFIALKVRS